MINPKHEYFMEDDKNTLVLRTIRESDIERLRQWRNQNKEHFFYSGVVTEEGQRSWYQKYLQDPLDYMFIVSSLGKPIGAAAIYNIDYNQETAEFGRLMIGDVSARGKGFGCYITALACKFAVDTFHVKRIFLDVFSDNRSAIASYLKAGFIEAEQGAIYNKPVTRMHYLID